MKNKLFKVKNKVYLQIKYLQLNMFINIITIYLRYLKKERIHLSGQLSQFLEVSIRYWHIHMYLKKILNNLKYLSEFDHYVIILSLTKLCQVRLTKIYTLLSQMYYIIKNKTIILKGIPKKRNSDCRIRNISAEFFQFFKAEYSAGTY